MFIKFGTGTPAKAQCFIQPGVEAGVLEMIKILLTILLFKAARKKFPAYVLKVKRHTHKIIPSIKTKRRRLRIINKNPRAEF
jgi:hypothetical protein